MRDPDTVCALLLVNAHVLRADYPELRAPGLREDITHRLAAAGMELIEPAFSDCYSVRPLAKNQEEVLPLATNFGVREPELALMVILWCKLAQPKRLQVPGPHRVHPDALAHEFAAQFGGKSNLERATSRLKTLDFLRLDDGYFYAGPALETMDGARMTGFVNERALLVEARDRILKLADDRHLGSRDVVLEYLRSTKEPVSARQISKDLNMKPEQVREALRALKTEKRVIGEGAGAHHKYRRTG